MTVWPFATEHTLCITVSCVCHCTDMFLL